MLRRYGSALLFLLSSIVALALVEVLVRLTAIDHRLVVSSLFFQGADVPVHQVSADPFLHYELKPGSHYAGSFPGKPPYEVNIDEYGARFPTHPLTKSARTFRILAFGGSTLYGGAVNDSETIAAALERRLNDEAAKAGDVLRFEVWNFGTSAYTLGQAAHLARQKLQVLSPDLILVQHHNRGRRGFFVPQNVAPEEYPAARFRDDPHFYREQFAAPRFLPVAVHRGAMKHSALYRSIVSLTRSLTVFNCDYCDQLSATEARALSREAGALHVPVIYFAIPADRGELGPDTIFPGLAAAEYVDLYRPDRDAAFYEVHPPAAVLDEFAALLVQELRARDVLPTMHAGYPDALRDDARQPRPQIEGSVKR